MKRITWPAVAFAAVLVAGVIGVAVAAPEHTVAALAALATGGLGLLIRATKERPAEPEA